MVSRYLSRGRKYRAAQENVAFALSDNIYNVQAFRILYQLMKEEKLNDIINTIGKYYEQTEKKIYNLF